ncbi:hypothetical protein, partial [Leptolyngbya sp. FACHB-321]|uniref:hypothetical protein n=1 Tax=Leptolyngbya sp. FACHB-321 TaxID=2692807 RepID=UPI001A7E547E
MNGTVAIPNNDFSPLQTFIPERSDIKNGTVPSDSSLTTKIFPMLRPSLYGLCSGAFFLSAFFLFKQGTDDLESNLDLVVANKKA